MCDRLGISAWEVIEAAATKPFGFLPHYPGPGLGGDCIPVVPHFLAWRLREYGYSAAADRGRARDQRAHAAARRAEGQRRAQRRTDCRSRARGSCCSAWRTRPTCTTRASRRASRCMRQLLSRGGDVRFCDPWVPESSSSTGTRHETVEWSARRGARRGLRRRAHPAPRVRRAAALGAGAARRGHAQRGPAGAERPARSSADARSSCSAPATSAARSPSWRWTRGRRGRARGQLVRDRARAARRARGRGARRDRRHPRPGARSMRCSARGSTAASSLAAQASRPLSVMRARLHRSRRTSPARGAWPRRSPQAACVVFGSSLHVYGGGPRLTGEIGADQPYGAQGDLAHLSKIYGELCLAHVRARTGFELATPAARDRLRPEPGGARPPGVADRRRQVPPARRAGRAADGRRRRPATIGVVHVEDAARILLEAGRRARSRTSSPRR